MSLMSARAAYMGTSVSTARPGALLVMLFDRLVLDLSRAGDAYEAAGATGNDGARQQLLHAQDIVIELRSSLDVDGFVGGRELAALYDYLLRRLIHANVAQDLEAVRECRSLAADLGETWREAVALTENS